MKISTLRDYSSPIVLIPTAVMIILIADSSANAIRQDSMIFPLDARGAGMGQTGNSDPANIANTAYNPAIVSMIDGLHIMWGHSSVPFALAEVKMDGVIAGMGHHRNINESIKIGGGLAVGYAKERWGFRGFDDPTPEWGAFHREYNITAGVSGMYNDIIRVGIGLNVKKWKWDNGSKDDFSQQVLEASLLDAGFEFTAVLWNKNEYLISTAAGFAYSNFGGDIEVIKQRVFLPDDGDWGAPEYRRYGMNLQFDSPSWGRADGYFDAELPVVSAAVNYDIVDQVDRVSYENARHAVGGELGFLDIFFFRAGRISQKEGVIIPGQTQKTLVDNTVGLGIAVPYDRYLLCFDYAQRSFDGLEVDQDLYSLLLEVSF
jgi:hypothetical protein